MHRQAQREIRVRIRASDRADHVLGARVRRVDPVPREVAQADARHTRTSRGRETERRNVGDDEVGASVAQKCRFGVDTFGEVVHEGASPAHAVGGVEAQAVDLRHPGVDFDGVEVEWPG